MPVLPWRRHDPKASGLAGNISLDLQCLHMRATCQTLDHNAMIVLLRVSRRRLAHIEHGERLVSIPRIKDASACQWNDLVMQQHRFEIVHKPSLGIERHMRQRVVPSSDGGEWNFHKFE